MWVRFVMSLEMVSAFSIFHKQNFLFNIAEGGNAWE